MDDLHAAAGELFRDFHTYFEQLQDTGCELVPCSANSLVPPIFPVVSSSKLPSTQQDAPPRTSADSPFVKPKPREVVLNERKAHVPQRVATSSAPVKEVTFAAPQRQVSPEKQARLTVIQERVKSCTQCALHSGRKQTVFARGSETADIMFVGEGPGADEDTQGFPFVGAAGQLLDRMIKAMGFSPDEVYIANIVKCRPPENRKPESIEMAACIPFLHEQIEVVRPKVLVAMGATAVEGLLGLSGIMKLRGNWRLYRGEIPVMPTFHPAYLLRYEEAKKDVWSDLKQVMERFGKKSHR